MAGLLKTAHTEPPGSRSRHLQNPYPDLTCNAKWVAKESTFKTPLEQGILAMDPDLIPPHTGAKFGQQEATHF